MGKATKAAAGAANRISHVVVLMLENRSFDHMLGSLQKELGLDGVDTDAPPRSNQAAGAPYQQIPGALRVFPDNMDPRHEYPNVRQQVNAGAMDGFAQDFASSVPHAQPPDIQQVMSYFMPGDLPALHTLARNFTVCDRWFASVPGPTWANRFFAHSGTSLGHLAMPEGLFNLHLHWYSQDTIYDRLNDAKCDWKIYYGDVPQSLLLVHQLAPANLGRYQRLAQFYADAAGDANSFPTFSFIEPEYYSPGQSDDHPPHDVLNGDHLIGTVYNALRRNEALFQETLLVVVWDEHGGFYDHVKPAPAEPPDNRPGEFDFDFRTLGVRVPAILVSPWTARRVSSDVFDHTSVLRFVIEENHLAPLGNRVATMTSVGAALLAEPRPLSQLPPSIPGLSPLETTRPTSSPDRLNENQRGLAAYSQYLATQTPEDPIRATERTAAMMTSARAQIDTSYDNFDRYLTAFRPTQGVKNGNSG